MDMNTLNVRFSPLTGPNVCNHRLMHLMSATFEPYNFYLVFFQPCFKGEVVFGGGCLCWHCLTRTLASGGVEKAARKSITGLAQLPPKPRSASVVK